jgi:hypothetical protein
MVYGESHLAGEKRDMVKPNPLAEQTNSERPKILTDWSGYVLGHHPPVLRILATLGFRRAAGGMAWAPVGEPWTQLGLTSTEVPSSYLDDLDQALTELAITRVIDAGRLVELHRAVDRLGSSCEEVVRLFELKETDAVYEESRNLFYEVDLLRRLSNGALMADVEEERARRLGVAIGEWLSAVCSAMPFGGKGDFECLDDFDFLDNLGILRTIEQSRVPAEWNSLINGIADQYRNAKEILSPLTNDALRRMYSLTRRKAPAIGRVLSDIAERMVAMDRQILEDVTRGRGQEPMLLVDHQQRELLFQGQRFPFDSFKDKARGGLKGLLVLADRPNTFVSRDEIIIEADLGAEPERLPEYFSALRCVLGSADRSDATDSATSQYLPPIDVLIVPRRGTRDNTVKSAYKLAIPSHLLRVIPADVVK